MPYGLSPETVQRICAILEKYPQISEAWLYGSRAMGTFRPGSDIDLTLKGHQLNLALLNRLSIELDDLLLPLTFDLSIYAQIENPGLREHIQRVGVRIYP